MTNQTIGTLAREQEVAMGGELDRIRFTSRNLLRLQGLWLVPVGLAGFVFFLAMSGIGFSFAIDLVFLAPAVPLLLYPLVIWYYPRILGEVHYSRAQTEALKLPMGQFSSYILAGLLLDMLVESSVSLVSVAFAAALFHQWKDEGSRVALLHYPAVASVALVTGLLPLVSDELPASIYRGGGESTLYIGVLASSAAVIGLCDHLVLMWNLKKLPKESS